MVNGGTRSSYMLLSSERKYIKKENVKISSKNSIKFPKDKVPNSGIENHKNNHLIDPKKITIFQHFITGFFPERILHQKNVENLFSKELGKYF